MLTKEFRLAQSDQVQASIREFNHDGFELEYVAIREGFEVFYRSCFIATVAFWGTQPAIKVTAERLQASCLLIGDEASILAGELIVLLVKEEV